jgi:hypothetical protein
VPFTKIGRRLGRGRWSSRHHQQIDIFLDQKQDPKTKRPSNNKTRLWPKQTEKEIDYSSSLLIDMSGPSDRDLFLRTQFIFSSSFRQRFCIRAVSPITATAS